MKTLVKVITTVTVLGLLAHFGRQHQKNKFLKGWTEGTT
ncbi:hypothetical protein LCGC14_1353570 [marine sediment metagenome]|uniref:Uncharacterized protein n=1 Tax=marine sediment metagenome TaxID=412755 RepID=A0A0F9MQS3_9ZZZZ